MALQKEKAFDFGITGNYWTIIHLNLGWISRDAYVAIACYRTEQNYLDGEGPIPGSTKSLSFNGDSPFVKGANNHASAYELFKAETFEDGFFTDAVDLL